MQRDRHGGLVAGVKAGPCLSRHTPLRRRRAICHCTPLSKNTSPISSPSLSARCSTKAAGEGVRVQGERKRFAKYGP